LAQERRQPEGIVLRSIRLRSPGRVLLIVALVALMFGTQGRIFHPAYHAIRLSCQLLHLRSKSEQLTQQNDQLADTVAYLETDAGQELAARSELGALRPGERLIITSSPPPRPVSSSASLSQLVHGCLTRAHAVVNDVAGYCIDLAKCLFGVGGGSAASAPGNGKTEGAE